MTKPNLLLITVDQMRFDCLSALGHSIIETPNLDALASSGVIFTNAYSATPTCVPARAAIMTGMSQRSHGRVGYQDKVPWQYEHTVAGELAKAGYHTQCVGKMHVYPARNLCGFHNIVLHDGYLHHNRSKHDNTVDGHFDQVDDYLQWLRRTAGAELDIMDNGLDCNASTVARPWHLPEMLHPTNWCVTESIDFLRRRDPSKPFFLWTSFVRPHSPLDPPQAYFDMYKNLELPDPPVGGWVDEAAAGANANDPTATFARMPKRRLDRARAAYYALISHLDEQIGRLINAMQEYGVHKDTLIVFTSDHGELIGDHHHFRKSLPYEGSAKIPFIVCDPSGRFGFAKGSRVEEVIELRDIMPTLLHAADVTRPQTVEGESLLPLCRGEHPEWRPYIHGEHLYGVLSHQFVTDGKEKFIWFTQTGEEQYFNLEDDPQELANAVADERFTSRVATWRNRLIEELEGREEGYVFDGKLVVGRQAKPCLDHLFKATLAQDS
ncbi:arylsulfatase [Paenibacillus sp. Soil766]|uniref:arylsulfatase n=1 Tax=Paenibacillus sp. Soil766 TaxID=1736404 RepID=UPI00070EC433|nr:arylsulfatase [Paenibacillus sp. Soil766]KRE83784.1 arylsulfatase [Paenibacillus sp. Soil766]